MKNNPCRCNPLIPDYTKKLFLIIRLTTILLIVASLEISAMGYSQESNPFLSSESYTLAELFENTETQSDFSLFSKTDQVDVHREVSLGNTNGKVSDLLATNLQGSNISYKVMDKLIVLTTNSDESQQQKITGTVIDASNGESLPGVYVLIEGTQIGTITDGFGKYALQVSDPNSVILFSSIGYMPGKVPYTGQAVIDVKMEPDLQALDEVVVVGYGQMKKKDLTSAITNVDSKQFIQGATNSVADLIKGKVAGLSVTSEAANPSSTPSLQIRGIGSLNASNEPLIIIDGVPGASLSSVAQQDIESFSVLKDGAAAAIYGTRGANGVIIITTKQASTREKVDVSYDSYISTQQITKYPDVMSRDRFLEVSRGPDLGGNTNWFKEISRPSFDQNHNLSVAYGSQNNSYRTSISYRKTLAITNEVDRTEYGGRINFKNSFLQNKLETSGSISVRNSTSNAMTGNVWSQALTNNPTMPIYDADGSFVFPDVSFYDNAVSMQKNNTNLTESKINNYDLTLKWNILKSLNSSFMYAQQIIDNDNYRYSNGKTRTNSEAGIVGVASRAYSKNTMQLIEWNTNYELTKSDHNLKILGGYSYQKVENASFNVSNSNFPSDALLYNNLGSGSYNALGKATMGSYMDLSKLIAFYGRAAYSYNDLLLATATIRHEGSTKYGIDNKWGTFKSISGALRISKMGIMSNLVESGIVEDLKLRVGYGETGRDIMSSYQSLSTYGGTSKFYIDGAWLTARGPNKTANPNLKWERSVHFNAGLDFTLINKRLTGSIDYFIKDSKDLLYTYPAIQPPMIANTIMLNVGTIRSKGYEWDLKWSTNPIKRFQYSVNFLGNYTKTRVMSLSNDLYSATFTDLYTLPLTGTPGTAVRLEEGSEVGLFYGYRYAGLDEAGDFLVYNKDGVVIPESQKSENDKTYIGHGVPRWQLTMNHFFAYKNFDLSLQFKSILDFNILNAREMYYGLRSTAEPNVLSVAYDKNNDIYGEKVYCDYFIGKGNYLKLDIVTLGYNIIGLSGFTGLNARLYFSVNNLFTITAYDGFDPTTLAVNGLTPSIEDTSVGSSIGGSNPNVQSSGVYPVLRIFTLGAKINF